MNELRRLREVCVKNWEKDGLEYFVIRTPDYPGMKGHYFGYVHFKVKPLRARKYYYPSILDMVQVHGNITYGESDKKGGYIWGFDCGHLCDKGWDFTLEWVMSECEFMGRQIQVLAQFEEEWVKTRPYSKTRRAVRDKIQKIFEDAGLVR